MTIVHDAPARQLGFFGNQQPPARDKLATPHNERLPQAFYADWQAIQPYPVGTVPLVLYPRSGGLRLMAVGQQLSAKTTARNNARGDLYSLAGVVAWRYYLGQSAQDAYRAWAQAKGRGNRGIHLECHGEGFGHRTVMGDSPYLDIPAANKHAARVQSWLISRVDQQHDGAIRVELLGWCRRHDLAGRLQLMTHKTSGSQWLRGSLSALTRDGLIQPAHAFQSYYAQSVGA